MFQIGDIEIYLFNDATAYMDPGGLFGLVPRVLWSRRYTADKRHLIRTATHNLLIRTAGMNIIVDTGFGNNLSDSQRRFLHIDEHDGAHRGLARPRHCQRGTSTSSSIRICTMITAPAISASMPMGRERPLFPMLNTWCSAVNTKTPSPPTSAPALPTQRKTSSRSINRSNYGCWTVTRRSRQAYRQS